MSIQIRPFKEIVRASKDKLRELMAGPRAARLKARAQAEMSDIDVEIITLGGKVEESLGDEESYKNFNFKALMDNLDRIAILKRRKKQYQEVLDQLFPKE